MWSRGQRFPLPQVPSLGSQFHHRRGRLLVFPNHLHPWDPFYPPLQKLYSWQAQPSGSGFSWPSQPSLVGWKSYTRNGRVRTLGSWLPLSQFSPRTEVPFLEGQTKITEGCHPLPVPTPKAGVSLLKNWPPFPAVGKWCRISVQKEAGRP